MSDVWNDDQKIAGDLLNTFSLYGFHKTSMQSLADTAGVSRQSIYKKFGSKNKCYEWVIETYLDDMYSQIFKVLDDDKIVPSQALFQVFDIFIGNAIEITKNAHGTAVLDDTLKKTHSSNDDWPLRFRTRLADYLYRHDFVTRSNSLGVAYTMISAGIGLLVEETTRDSFTNNMNYIISSINQLDV